MTQKMGEDVQVFVPMVAFVAKAWPAVMVGTRGTVAGKRRITRGWAMIVLFKTIAVTCLVYIILEGLLCPDKK